jgi:hypothetical protein
VSDRSDRSERLRRRFERSGSAAESAQSGEHADGTGVDDGTADAEAASPPSGGSADAGASATSQRSVKERPSTLMYLPNEIDRDLDLTFDEVNLRYRRAFEEKLEKNRDYYPLVAMYGLRTLQEWDAEDVREALRELRA